MGESATLQGVYLTDFYFRRQAINKWLLSLLDCSLGSQFRDGKVVLGPRRGLRSRDPDLGPLGYGL